MVLAIYGGNRDTLVPDYMQLLVTNFYISIENIRVYNRGYLFWYDVTKYNFVYKVFTSYTKSSRVANSG